MVNNHYNILFVLACVVVALGAQARVGRQLDGQVTQSPDYSLSVGPSFVKMPQSSWRFKGSVVTQKTCGVACNGGVRCGKYHMEYDEVDNMPLFNVTYFKTDKSINKFDNAGNVDRAVANTVIALTRYDLLAERGSLKGRIEVKSEDVLTNYMVEELAFDVAMLATGAISMVIAFITMIIGAVKTSEGSLLTWDTSAPTSQFSCYSSGWTSYPDDKPYPETNVRLYAPDSMMTVVGVVVTDEYIQLYPHRNYLRHALGVTCNVNGKIYESSGDNVVIWHKGSYMECGLTVTILTYDVMKAFHRKNTIWYQDEMDMLKLYHAGEFYFAVGNKVSYERPLAFCNQNTHIEFRTGVDELIKPSDYGKAQWINKVGWDPITPAYTGPKKYREIVTCGSCGLRTYTIPNRLWSNFDAWDEHCSLYRSLRELPELGTAEGFNESSLIPGGVWG
uniref:Uncharacterized protein n=1 Tax=Crithidia otongatchiensis leishbunyavirus TaxID=1890414 RepID=A0A3S6FHX5_9VIRU|nr:hypothetical protein [Crithidia otongatchiensis leishbunyavirus]